MKNQQNTQADGRRYLLKRDVSGINDKSLGRRRCHVVVRGSFDDNGSIGLNSVHRGASWENEEQS